MLIAATWLCGCDLSVPAFPGAEGFGTDTPGGRGGVVLFVTNLNDAGPGSLRAALAHPAPRTVVFRVGGTITLQSPLEITSPYLTVAGQTAPGGGIQLRNEPHAPYALAEDSFDSIRIGTHDVVLRFLRVRPGPLDPNPACTGPNAVPHPRGWDTCVDANNVRAIHLLPGAHHIVLDHLSLAWSSDELVAVQGATDFTLSWSMLAEGMDYVLYEGFFEPVVNAHGHGIILGDLWSVRAGKPTQRFSLHHNLWAHNSDRNPQLTAECASATQPERVCTGDVVNNVAYDWRRGGLNIGNRLGHTFLNVEGNFLQAGPDTPNLVHALELSDWAGNTSAGVPNAALRVHSSGNRVRPNGRPSTSAALLCSGWDAAMGTFHTIACGPYESARQPAPPVTRSPAGVARDAVLADAGASRRVAGASWHANRDLTDQRVVADVRNGTGQIIDSRAEFPGWPSLAGGAAPIDGDSDGMPSGWEASQCLDDAAPDDARDPDGDGYTNLEEYLNATSPNDADGDGVPDHRDDCRFTANPAQRDDDPTPDGIGDACDCDFDADGDCDDADSARFEACRARPRFPACDPFDLDDDGVLNARDASLHADARRDGRPGPGPSHCPY